MALKIQREEMPAIIGRCGRVGGAGSAAQGLAGDARLLKRRLIGHRSAGVVGDDREIARRCLNGRPDIEGAIEGGQDLL